MIDNMLSWANSLSDISVTIIYLVFMAGLVVFGRQESGHWMIGIMLAEVINIWNLTIYLTSWLGLEIKPFMPLWITIILLIMPFIVLMINRITDKKRVDIK